MNKYRIIGALLVVTAWVMFAVAGFVEHNINLKKKVESTVISTDVVEVKDLAAAKRVVAKVTEEPKKEEAKVEAVSMEAVPKEEPKPVTPPRVEVYEHMTLDELAAKLDRSLNSNLAGKGRLIAEHSLQVGVDPIVATAIMLHETGCNWRCSNLVVACNNVGGQKGSPVCGNGGYKGYPTLDAGIVGMIDNLARNYYSRGLNTVELIGPRYAESGTWVAKINSYIYAIRAK